MSTVIERAVRGWWAENPMTYGAAHGTTRFVTPDGERTLGLGTREFFDSADDIFYAQNRNLHDATGHFARIFPYARYRDKPVLEIGCGLGCMAMNWAQHGALVSAVDLNTVAVRQTGERFRLHGLPADLAEADARQMPFASESFEYVYSWGVLHHSPDIERSVAELRRVLRPGGQFGVMLYNRDSLLFRYTIAYLQGFLNFERRFLDDLQLASRYGDGDAAEGNPHTWPITVKEAKDHLFARFQGVQVKVLGTDVDYVLSLVLPGLGSLLPLPLRQSLARRWGWSLWITGRKT